MRPGDVFFHNDVYLSEGGIGHLPDLCVTVPVFHDGEVVAFVQAFAAGAILTMLADTMMPEAYEHGGKLVGVMTALGFAIAFTIHVFE